MTIQEATLFKNMCFEVPSGIELIDIVMAGEKTYQTLVAALELQLFDWLDEKGAVSREEIITGLNLNGMYTRSFLQSLIDMGFLTLSNEKYANSGAATSFLLVDLRNCTWRFGKSLLEKGGRDEASWRRFQCKDFEGNNKRPARDFRRNNG